MPPPAIELTRNATPAAETLNSRLSAFRPPGWLRERAFVRAADHPATAGLAAAKAAEQSARGAAGTRRSCVVVLVLLIGPLPGLGLGLE